MPRALVVDDSFTIRMIVRKILNEIGFQVEEAPNGFVALQKINLVRPDLIILDLVLPKMDGLTVLKKIMNKYPTNVIMISAFKSELADIALTALEHGALSVVSKKSTSRDNSLYQFKQDLQQKAKESLLANVGKRNNFYKLTKKENYILKKPRIKIKSVNAKDKLIIIGASTGGPSVIREIISNLQPNIPPIIIIQHFPVGFSNLFASRLNKITSLNVIEAEEGLNLKINTVYVAPGGKHLVFKEKGVIHLFEGDKVNNIIPSIDITSLSASYHYSENLVSVILTGLGNNGLSGVRYSKQHGVRVIAQDKESSIIFGMPKAIIDANLADFVYNPLQICYFLNLF